MVLAGPVYSITFDPSPPPIGACFGSKIKNIKLLVVIDIKKPPQDLAKEVINKQLTWTKLRGDGRKFYTKVLLAKIPPKNKK